ncbi:MAG: SpvB/TcaC N-terminal domain-containing protein, partial [Anaerolineae bacterium]
FLFELSATEMSGLPVTQFAVGLTLRYRDPAAGDEQTPWPPGATLFFQGAADGRWVVLPTSVDQEQRQLITTLTHFTLFAAGNSIVPEPAPGIEGVQSQLYNGAWTVSYPIAAPPGPGGLAPGLSLDYSSRSLAGAGHHQLAGWGWDIGGLSYILRSLDTGKYTLTLNGVTHELEEHGGTFYSVQDPFLKIRRPTASNPDYPSMEYFDPSTPTPFSTIDLPQTPGEYNRDNLVWEVTTEGGITYHFEPALYVRDCSNGDWTPSEQRVVHRFTKWVLTEVRDTTPTVPNRLTFNYDYEGTRQAGSQPAVCSNHDYTADELIQVRAARVKEISYGPNGIFKLKLFYLNREDRAEHFDETGYQVFWTRKYLQRVEVMANNTLLHKAVLGMTAFTNPAAPSQSRLYLSTITRYGTGSNALPPTSYTYGSGTTDGHMVTVNNGYQGRVEVTYGGSSGGMVVQQERRRGGGSDPDIVTSYWYTTTWDNEAGGFAEAEMTLVGSGALIGSGQPDTRIRQWFHTTTNQHRWKGKLSKTETRAGLGVTNNLLARTLQTWNETSVGTPGGMTFVYLQDKTEYVADPNGTDPPLRYTKSVNTYDAAYGNLLLTRLYSEAAPTIPYRT